MKDPLSDFYRSKEVYITLPSGGNWYKNPPNLTEDGEIGIYPMSVKDEIMLKIPDTLYNGEALYEIIKSVAPDIPDPYEVIMPDFEIILLASKIGQHGGELNITGTCPHCQKTDVYSIKITDLLRSVKKLPTDGPKLELENGLSITFKPNTLASVTAGNIKTTESIRLAAAIADGMHPEETKTIFKDSLEKSTAATIVVLSDAIESIETPTGEIVSDIVSISNWVANSDARTTQLIKKQSVELNRNGVPESFNFQCSSEDCNETFDAKMEYNPAFFFTNNYDQPLT